MYKLAALSAAQLKAIISKAGKFMDRQTLHAKLLQEAKAFPAGSDDALRRIRMAFSIKRPSAPTPPMFPHSKEFGRDVLPPRGKAQELARKQIARQSLRNGGSNYLPVKSRGDKSIAKLLGL